MFVSQENLSPDVGGKSVDDQAKRGRMQILIVFRKSVKTQIVHHKAEMGNSEEGTKFKMQDKDQKLMNHSRVIHKYRTSTAQLP